MLVLGGEEKEAAQLDDFIEFRFIRLKAALLLVYTHHVSSLLAFWPFSHIELYRFAFF